MKDIEVERKYKISENIYKKVLTYFEKEKESFKLEKQNDIYFSPVHFPFFGGDIDNECLRIRVLADKNILSYKKFYPEEGSKPAHCVEHEVEVLDIEEMKLILSALRINEVFTLKKDRHKLIYNDSIEIALDEVDNIGYFIEFEIIKHDDLVGAQKEIQALMEIFNINEDMRNYDGYAYILYKESLN